MSDLSGAHPPIPFNRPFASGRELEYIASAYAQGRLSGDGAYTRTASAWLERAIGCERALLTHSCTAALEMSALVLDIKPGDEVILPSFTFVSTASAFALRGAVPVFVDIRPDTLNLDEALVEAAVTPRTRAICAVHYAGVACELDALLAIAGRHGLALVEDAAQALLSTYRDKPLGSFGELGALSFHETKNVTCGEGGALLVNQPALVARAEVVRQKGTDRSRFDRGEVDRYTWQDLGSSFLPGEISAALLSAQLESAHWATAQRMLLWDRYHAWAERWEQCGLVRRPRIPRDCRHNAHMYHLRLGSRAARDATLAALNAAGVNAVSHYVPLHSSPAGRRLGRTSGSLTVTEAAAGQLLRMPLWVGLEPQIDSVLARADAVLATLAADGGRAWT